MNTSCLYNDTDWLIYADYLDDQNINHFIREDLQGEQILWHYEFYGFNFNSVGVDFGGDVGAIQTIGFSGVGGIGHVGSDVDGDFGVGGWRQC
jgi:hypothetical protein